MGNARASKLSLEIASEGHGITNVVHCTHGCGSKTPVTPVLGRNCAGMFLELDGWSKTCFDELFDEQVTARSSGPIRSPASGTAMSSSASGKMQSWVRYLLMRIPPSTAVVHPMYMKIDEFASGLLASCCPAMRRASQVGGWYRMLHLRCFRRAITTRNLEKSFII